MLCAKLDLLSIATKATHAPGAWATSIFLFGAGHYEKPSTGYKDLENILLAHM